MFVWLGSGRARKYQVAEPGRLMDQATRAGLPVPPGAILLDSFYQFTLKEGLGVIQNGRYRVLDPDLLFNTLFFSIRLPRFDRPVLLRPIVDGESGGSASQSFSDVDFRDADDMARALASIWSDEFIGGPARREVLVMEMIQATNSGTANVISDTQSDQVNLHASEDPRDLNQTRGSSFTLPHLSRFQAPESDRPLFARRLQMLLRGVRRTFGTGEWEVDWVDDGHICWLVKILPVVRVSG